MGVRGIAKVDLVGSAGSAVPQGPGVGYYNFLYQTSLVKDPKWNVGDRVVLPDGRAFRFARCSNIISEIKYGVKFWNRIADGITGATLSQGEVAGATSIKIGGAGVTLDEYRGGYIIIHVGATNRQFRGIVGNSAVDAAGDIVVYLDAPIVVPVTTATSAELLQCPYGNVRCRIGEAAGTHDYTSVAGLPNVLTVAANQYLWIQTWGPIWINPHGASLFGAGLLGGERKVVFDWEGSICIEDDVAHGGGGATDEHQVAGFIIDRQTAAVEGPPLIMLQISP